jgi:hypothetical protein
VKGLSKAIKAEKAEEELPGELPGDSIYLVLSGEFVAIQTLVIENKAQDANDQNQHNNKTFLNQ